MASLGALCRAPLALSGPGRSRRPATVRASAFAGANVPIQGVSVAPVATITSIETDVAAPRSAVVPSAVALADAAVAAAVACPSEPAAAALPLAQALEAEITAICEAEATAAQDASSAARSARRAALAVLAAPYRGYARALEERPLLTKALTSCVGFMAGDLLAQHFGHQGGAAAGFDALRVLRLGLYGLCLDGPMGSLWYDWLEGAVFPDRPTEAKAVVAKTLLDQVVYASIGTGLFFAVITTLEGHTEAAGSVVAAKFWPTLAANWAIWPAAHMVNFRFVPSQFRIAYNNVVAIGWLALLSAITHSHGSGFLSAALSHLHISHGQ